MSGGLTTFAAQLRGTGATWSEILSQLQARGASRLDLVRVVRDIDGMSLSAATKVVNDFGGTPTSEFEVTVDEDDLFYDQLFTDEYQGKPDDDH